MNFWRNPIQKRADLALELQGSKIIEFLKKSNTETGRSGSELQGSKINEFLKKSNTDTGRSGSGAPRVQNQRISQEIQCKRTSLRVWAWKLPMDAFLLGTLKETEQSESLRVWASELQMDAFLIRILKETKQSESLRDQSENLSLGAPNGCFSC